MSENLIRLDITKRVYLPHGSNRDLCLLLQLVYCCQHTVKHSLVTTSYISHYSYSYGLAIIILAKLGKDPGKGCYIPKH